MRREQVLGHDRALSILDAACARGRIAHAYLFAGPEGVGKESVAWVFAEGLLCDAGPRVGGCGVCPACRKVGARSHPDAHALTAEKDSIPIDAVRTLTTRLQMTAYEGRFKVAIVQGAHQMNPAAQNALLKTLEEPPGDAVLILCTSSPQVLLPTVRSRCQRVAFAPLHAELVRTRLATLTARPEDDPALTIAIALSEGSMGRALQILDEGRYKDRAALTHAVERLDPNQPGAVLDLAEAWGKDRAQATQALEVLQLWYRDRILDALGSPPGDRALADVAPERETPFFVALRALDLVHEARQAILGNVSPQLTLERTFFAVADVHLDSGA